MNGHIFRAAVNLEGALRRLRHASTERLLWVDALCINQADSIEKSHQVNMMGEIYSKSAGVIIWLGDYVDTPLRAIVQNEQPPTPTTPAATIQIATRADIESAFLFCQGALYRSAFHQLTNSGAAAHDDCGPTVVGPYLDSARSYSSRQIDDDIWRDAHALEHPQLSGSQLA